MVYSMNDKYYINISPSIYVEVIILDNGDIQATNNKIEVASNAPIMQISVKDVLERRKLTQNNNNENEIKRNKEKIIPIIKSGRRRK